MKKTLINSFFKPVGKGTYQDQCDEALEKLGRQLEEEKATKKRDEEDKKKKQLERRNKVYRINKRKAELVLEKLRAQGPQPVFVLDEDGLHHRGAPCLVQADHIEVLTDVQIAEEMERLGKKTKKPFNYRPEHWKDIAELFRDGGTNGAESVKKMYPKEFESLTFDQVRTKCRGWARDITNGKSVSSKGSGGTTAIGSDVDQELIQQVRARIAVGLSMDAYMLQTLCRALLKRQNKEDILLENGGKCTLGAAWCNRFYKRHKLRYRVATTKMRDAIPADFDEKKEKYLQIGSQILHQYSIPPALSIGGDETAVMLVSKMTRTMADKGSKRVRLLGIGDNDKAQVRMKVFNNVILNS